jgi:hypothetical protein
MARKKAVEEVKETVQPSFTIKFEVVGAEEVILTDLTADSFGQIRQWFSGLGSPTLEVPVGDKLILLDRAKVAYLVIAQQQS